MVIGSSCKNMFHFSAKILTIPLRFLDLLGLKVFLFVSSSWAWRSEVLYNISMSLSLSHHNSISICLPSYLSCLIGLYPEVYILVDQKFFLHSIKSLLFCLKRLLLRYCWPIDTLVYFSWRRVWTLVYDFTWVLPRI